MITCSIRILSIFKKRLSGSARFRSNFLSLNRYLNSFETSRMSSLRSLDSFCNLNLPYSILEISIKLSTNFFSLLPPFSISSINSNSSLLNFSPYRVKRSSQPPLTETRGVFSSCETLEIKFFLN